MSAKHPKSLDAVRNELSRRIDALTLRRHKFGMREYYEGKRDGIALAFALLEFVKRIEAVKGAR